jgi:trk system potassium uptake protein TrkH
MPRGSGDLYEALEREVARPPSLWRRLTAPQLLAASFLLLIAFGTVLLLVVPGLYTGERLDFIDALFMATSAVCVTGLAVVDVATAFTPFGQVIYLLLVQLGGIGILSITTVVILWLGGRITLRSEETLGTVEAGPVIETGRLVRAVLRYAFGIEALGALALWIAWSQDLGLAGAIWPAIFHAVSAFCNAGFSNVAGGLIAYNDRPVILVVIMALIVLGGIGFLVLEELFGGRWRTGRPLSLHTRLVLLTTLVLIVGGAILFAFFEWHYGFAPYPWGLRVVQAFFLSVTPRTAGFVSLDYNQLTTASLFLTIVLMMIGGSPGSTAGGFKTTTVAILVALAVTRIRGGVVTHVFRRTIPEPTIQRAVGLVVMVTAFLSAAILVLQVTELGGIAHQVTGGRFLELTVEAVSAYNTVGLSIGITPLLTWGGKLLLSILMYVGRVGPLTFAASMMVAAQKARPRVRYSTEDVIIG